MELTQIPQLMHTLEEQIQTLSRRLNRLEAEQSGRSGRINMATTEDKLGISRTYIRRLVAARIITTGQRIGSGRNAKWTFDRTEIEELARNPHHLNLPETV
jgi:hypothetical protein